MPITTPQAFLPSAGLNERRATLHKYSHSEMVTVPGDRKGETVTGLAHFYRCEETGELRRWGFDAAFPKDN